MTLTIGTGPFGPQSAGTFNFTREGPRHALYWEPSDRRVRVVFKGESIADSRSVMLLHETGHLPVYYFPLADVRSDVLEPTDHSTHCPFKGDARYWSVRVGDRVAPDAVWNYEEPIDGCPPIAGHVAFYWDRMDHWYEEDEEVFVHPRDPYHRVDVVPSSRHVRICVDGELIAESDRPMMLFETGLPPRYYLPLDDVRDEVLVPSDSHTRCPYKGIASYWSVKTSEGVHEDLGWYYPGPIEEAGRIRGLVAFYNEHVDITCDGEELERPVTRFSKR